MSYEEMWQTLEGVQEQVLRREVRRKVYGRGGGRVAEAEWMTEEIR